jgi:fructokinase
VEIEARRIMPRRRALVFGEAVIDEYPDRRVPAGGPLHIAAHLAALGWEAAVVSRVGDDADGRHLVETAARHGLDTSLIEVDAGLPTGRVTIRIHDDLSHSFTCHRPAAWDATAGPDPVPAHEVLVFGTVPLRDPRSQATLSRLLKQTAGMVVVDANLRPSDIGPDEIRFAVGVADLVKTGAGEVQALADSLGVAATAEGLHGYGPEWLCVTAGAGGARLTHRDGGRWDVPGRRVEVVDTVGAGDAFLAGLIHGLRAGDDGGSALRLAAERATAVVGRRGGLPPD